ncbi:retrovirus-related pol polyprotein from transposon TNT 1-94 [Tanacetum coccineum]
MLCYLIRMKPYYIQCIKDGPFKPKTAKGNDKPKSQWTPNERRVVNQGQRYKCIIISCLPDDIMESIISCETAKDTWTDLVHNFKGPSDTKENKIMDLKLEYQTFRAKTSKSLSQTYTRYKTLLNEIANDGVTLSKHEINVGFVNSLPEKWLSFSPGLRNANHTRTLDLADIYGRFDFKENSDDEADERTSEEYLRDLDIEFHERALLANSKRFIKGKTNFSIQKANEDTECYKCDDEEVSDDEDEIRVQVLMALADDELSVGKNHGRNGEWIDITIKKVNILLSMDEDSDWQNYLKYINIDLNEKIPNQKKKILGGEQLTESSSKIDAKDNPFVPASLDYDHEMLLKSKEWAERLNFDIKLPNFNTRRILVPESEAVNECLQLTEVTSDPESSKESGLEPQTPLPLLKIFRELHQALREPVWYLDNGCSRSMTGVKSYLHKYVEQPVPKIVFGDNSSCITEGYGSINCGGIVFSKVAFVNGLKYNLISISQLCDAKYIIQFDDKQGTIFNANKEIVLRAPRRNDVYVLDMSSLTPNGACFFAKASESVNWLWHKRLSHLNFKNINKLAKKNKVLGLLSLVYSKDKPCSAYEKGKHKRASFKTKQNFSIRKCLHLLYMDLFGHVSPMPINHDKYTLVIVDEHSRMVENQNDVKVKQIRTDNGTEFRNTELESFCDEKGISQNFSSPYRTLIEAARTMLNGSVLSKHFWTKAVRIACYTQNRSIIVKRHDRTPHDTVFNTRRQQVEETHHVTFDESMEAIRFTNTSVDEIGIDDSSRYPLDEFIHEDDQSR